MLDPEEAKSVTVPMCVLASKDEDSAEVSSFGANLRVPKHIQTFEDQIHGWMAARGDLNDPAVSERYREGYQTVLEFFGRQLYVL